MTGGLRTRDFAGPAILLAGLLALYGGPLVDLANHWNRDANYSHGYLILPAAAWMVWRDRSRLVEAAVRPSSAGLLLVFAGLLVLFTGVLGAELFLTRVSLLLVLAGGVLYLWGATHLRMLAFPLAFLVLMIPLPTIIFNQIAFPLQILASRLGVFALRLGDVPVLREGNVIALPNTVLEVAEACSGIRSLVSLLTLGVLFGYVSGHGVWRRAVLALLTIPIAIVANAVRVAGAGLTAMWYGPAAVEGFLHSFSGLLTFALSLALLFASDKLLGLVEPSSWRQAEAELVKA